MSRPASSARPASSIAQALNGHHALFAAKKVEFSNGQLQGNYWVLAQNGGECQRVYLLEAGSNKSGIVKGDCVAMFTLPGNRRWIEWDDGQVITADAYLRISPGFDKSYYRK